jgi:hypothetical protein
VGWYKDFLTRLAQETMMTHLAELRSLQRRDNRVGIKVTLFVDEEGVIDQTYIQGRGVRAGLRDPLSAAEYLRGVLFVMEAHAETPETMVTLS